MKDQYKKYLRNVISILLIFAFMCPIFLKITTVEVNAAEGVTNQKENIIEMDGFIDAGVNLQENSTYAEKAALEKNEAIAEEASLFSELDVPGFVSRSQIEEFGHVSRLHAEETLNTLVYLNRDGTKTKYVMDYPVKYIDEGGEIKFIDLSLSEGVKSFDTVANDIKLSVSKDYTKGITLSYKDYLVSLVAMPEEKQSVSGNINTAPIIVATKRNNAVTYNDVFGVGIGVKYSPLYNGIKEDIILQSYKDVNTFNFLLNTGGLRVYSEKNNYYLAESANADMRMEFGKVIAYDANLKISEGNLTVTEIKESQLYQVTVSVDQAFLTDPTTVYPVQIDPSIKVSDSSHGANAVIDSPVYSGRPTVNMGSALYNPIGYLDSTYQTGRTAIKLAGLTNDPVYQGLTSSQILSAYFYIKDSSGTAAKATNLYALTSNSTWTETSLTWNTVGSISSTLQATANVGGGAWASFNITNLVKGWKSGVYNINCGFILKSSDESLSGNFFSSETAEENWPYLMYTYADGTSSVTLSAASISMLEGDTRTLTATTNPVGQNVYWTSSQDVVATISQNGVITAHKPGTTTILATMVDPDGVIKTAECIVYVHIANGVYYIKNMSTNYVLEAKDGNIKNYTDVQQASKYGSSAADRFRIKQLWKIFYLGNGRYSIRPMHKLNMGLDVTLGNVDIFRIGTVDSLTNIPSYGRWSIEWDETGYIFKSDGREELTLQSTSTSPVTTVVAAPYSTGQHHRWNLIKENSPPSGILLYNKTTGLYVANPVKTVNPQDTVTLDQLNLEVAVYSGQTINQSVLWSSLNGNTATVNISDGSVTGRASGTTTITASKTIGNEHLSVAYQIKVNNNAVIIIPGIMGTELVAGPNNTFYVPGTKLWSQDMISQNEMGVAEVSILINKILSLHCDSNGNSSNDIVPLNNINEDDNLYNGLYGMLSNEFQDRYAIKFFAYDWRLSNAVSAGKLNEFINDFDYDNVILVCHSMGGLVASGYLSLGAEQRNKVEMVITLGSPLLGTPLVPYLWGSEDINATGMFDESGWSQFILTVYNLFAINNNSLNLLLCNFPSIYEMFPTEKYFDNAYEGDDYLTISGLGINETEITTYAETRNVLSSLLPYFKTNIADSAENFHDSLYVNGEHITSLVNTHYIAGIYDESITSVEYNGVVWSASYETGAGDGTVITKSATLGNRYSGKVHMINGVSHNALVSNINALNLIGQLIEEET